MKDGARILVGAITGARGLRGEVHLKSFTEDPYAIAEMKTLTLGTGQSIEIEALNGRRDGLVARLRGITTREAAEKLKGASIYAPRDALPPTEADEFYLGDLIGLSVSLASGEVIGSVIGVENFGAGDLLDVQLANEARSVYVPFTASCVPRVDLTARQVTIDPPLGLLDNPSTEKPDII